MDIVPPKRCARCKQEKPATLEYFGKHAKTRDRLNSWCRTCVNSYYREKQGKSPRQKQIEHELLTGTRRCSHCKEYYPATREYFGANPENRYGLQSWCLTCCNERATKYWRDNPDVRHRHKITSRELNKKPEVRQHTNKRGRERYAKNPRRAEHNARSHKRRALKMGAEGSHTAADIETQYRAQKGLCWHCGKELNGKYEVDHLIPLDKGGTNWPNNLFCSCRECNRSKGAKYTYEWNGRLF